ncbi:MAG: hypothetical protein EAZ92_02590 [Candidatus Kapaibacterium sp.]|nr:MAG: hypothetical protein EAZ92_02590 [Candidatus Kapabacteria bacterium]
MPLFLLCASCGHELRPTPNTSDSRADSLAKQGFSVEIEKWYNAHTAALSITFDAGWVSSPLCEPVNDHIRKRKLHLGYEMVTSGFRAFPELFRYAEEHLEKEHFSFFGHGDYHVAHDKLLPDSAYSSFLKCWTTMKNLGLQPISYAYPEGAGFFPWTQDAVRRAGFLSARAHNTHLSGKAMLIVPDGIKEPANWYFLPSLVMQNENFARCADCINNTRELVPYLDMALKHHAWIISTYHAIGDTTSWGYYQLHDFIADMDSIAKRDFWCTSMDNITLYVRERARARVELSPLSASSLFPSPNNDKAILALRVSDDLDNAVFSHALTLTLRLPHSWKGQRVVVTKQGMAGNVAEYSVQSSEQLGQYIRMNCVPDEETYVLRCVVGK